MSTNVWDEQMTGNELLDFHAKEVEKMQLPEWLHINCPFCDELLPITSIRSVGFRMNTRNIGDITVEFACSSCSQMDTLYFHDELESVSDFVSFLSGENSPKGRGVVEREMYKSGANNTAERMAREYGAVQNK